MKYDTANDDGGNVADYPPIEIPPIVRVTPEEIERRRVLREAARRIRERIGQVGVNAADLIDLDFYDDRSA
jgi:hypothetical protein